MRLLRRQVRKTVKLVDDDDDEEVLTPEQYDRAGVFRSIYFNKTLKSN